MIRNLVLNVLKLKCPNCGKGDMFCNKKIYQYKGFFDMPKECKVCQQDFQIEPGFYYGTMYVSYVVTIAVTLAIFTIMQIFSVFSIKWFLSIDIVVLFVILPYVFKISRALWLSLMIKKQ